MFERAFERRISINEKEVPQIYLYIPFSASEWNQELYVMAKEWQENIAKSAKLEKIPHIIMHRKENEADAFCVYYQNQKLAFKFNFQTIPQDSVIYIFAHGGNRAEFVASATFHGNYLSMKELARRLKADGLTQVLAEKLKAIRLFACDVNGMTTGLAYNLAEGLGEDYRKLRIEFYDKELSFPSEPPSCNMIAHKEAYDNLDRLVGRARDFKKGITVGDVLDLHKEKSYQNETIGNTSRYSLANLPILKWWKIEKPVDEKRDENHLEQVVIQSVTKTY